eukprot:CAMPEP_0170580906 /NCGR_PEP_ID=MMETSP0224-20130122/6756_1 /TAXON_ID=285029 /ORGANISM="Togula jolla, Strain CCCM 725" /LENGTH=65 /DNA_ID=CAMNT_0010904007 /DNA_START=135 /DNA_END=331 /DNA_ORIENTATION=+
MPPTSVNIADQFRQSQWEAVGPSLSASCHMALELRQALPDMLEAPGIGRRLVAADVTRIVVSAPD